MKKGIKQKPNHLRPVYRNRDEKHGNREEESPNKGVNSTHRNTTVFHQPPDRR